MDSAVQSLRWRAGGDEKKNSEKRKDVGGATSTVLNFPHNMNAALSQLNVGTLEVSFAAQTTPRSKETALESNSWLR